MFVQDSHSLNFLNIFFFNSVVWFAVLVFLSGHLKVKDGLSTHHSINLFFSTYYTRSQSSFTHCWPSITTVPYKLKPQYEF